MSNTSAFPPRAEIRRLAHEARTYLFSVRTAPANGVRVLIFAQGRTGSTVLESLLASTGHFRKNGEVLKERALRVLYPGAYVKGLARDPSKLSYEGHFICHVKIDHLTSMRKEAGRRPADPAQFLRTLAADGWRFLYLHRENYVRHAVSNMVAWERGGYHKRNDQPESLSLHVKRPDLERQITRRIQGRQAEQSTLNAAGVPYHEVVYERDLLDGTRHQATSDRVMDFLGLERRPVETSMRKVNVRPLSDTISNYEEFAEWVRESGFGASLDPQRGSSSA